MELRPPDKTLGDFKRELRKILDAEGIQRTRFKGYSRMGRYMLKDLPGWLIDAWIRVRKSRIS